MARTSQQHLDDEILDHAAALFARRGFSNTSIQAVADALGYSKSGLLHHYSTKFALYDAVISRCRTQAQGVLDEVSAMPVGDTRDRVAVTLVVEMALDNPGIAALLISPREEVATELDEISTMLYAAFGDTPDGPITARLIRITGGLAAVAVIALNITTSHDKARWRSLIISTGLGALGHPYAEPLPTTSNDLEV
ncbi:TetR/AcrR family transcriptional regulator [Rhodococcoides yunnanense]|uniref:TetR/AcrR family transcriptional regulator n=1 Tax=Rhodococcoides yunnanense TaxID=278209 RepID=A0ABU4B6J8_9NOCA|nr:TetR/AcrR family transcriptional regulator [Rhodococcus yunnanensis]MDV6259814.1 TetR/AcrR family transcriptional regulator [Rhodococcus yunnanensis]